MIDIHGVAKNFGSFAALRELSLRIAEGELVALLGPSGSGKTTLLRIIAGLEFPDRGKVLFEGRDTTHLSARDRRVGFVFQHFALFRHMNVRENISFGLRVRDRSWRPHRREIESRVEHLLAMVQLEGLAERYPSQLSGGQRQRVALARALAIEPRVLLLDEPFGALDAKVRKELRRWLRRLHDDLGITGIFVTHDQEEALEVADRVVVMNHGAIEQAGSPAEIYDRPASPFVYRFLGNVNSLPCRVDDGKVRLNGDDTAALHGEKKASGRGQAFVRPHDIEISGPGENGIKALVRHVVVLGPSVRVELELSSEENIEAEITRRRFSELGLERGAEVSLGLRQAEIFLEDGRKFAAAPFSNPREEISTAQVIRYERKLSQAWP